MEGLGGLEGDGTHGRTGSCICIYIYFFFLDVDFIWFKRRNYTLQTGPGMSH